MSNFVIALLAAIAAASWIYSKMIRKTGNNKKSSITVMAISGILAFVLVYLVLGVIFSSSQ